MNKAITINKSDFTKKLSLISNIVFDGLSASELNVLSKLIYYSINNSLSLILDISRQIHQDLDITPSNFNTIMFRLEKKKVLVKSGKIITLNPILHNIAQLENLVITFNPL